MSRVFESAGIHQRHAVRPIEWFVEPRSWPDRTAAYLEAATELFVKVARKALDEIGLSAQEIDTVVTISSTGIATPSLEARAASQLGFRSDILRVPVFGLGCAGGVSGLAIASQLAEARPGTKVLVVAVELCTLAFRLDELTKANIVATALFGDGAAACVLTCGEEGFAEVEASGQHTWPDTLDIMGWSVDPQGFGVIFDRSIPPFAEAELRPAVDAILAKNDLSRADVDRFICHPGGTKVMQAIEHALDLEQGALGAERDVLRDYGNMSAPTVLFVLDRLRRLRLPPRSVLTAMGPGFTASCLTLRASA
ncbi:chalcone synthase [Devosia pacifica]|uniref:Chalcone synthase n=2 Tax=Devosia pacifica TaxID=1335967 RepID=A0A918S8H4_9HYPH|nr:chalcone synthase [Devosia pacifica]